MRREQVAHGGLCANPPEQGGRIVRVGIQCETRLLQQWRFFRQPASGFIGGGQLACLDLKLASINALAYDDFFSLWGESSVRVFNDNYKTKLRGLLKLENSKLFWDNNAALFRDNFMFAGSSGLFAWLLQIPMRLSGVRDQMIKRLSGPPKSLGLQLVIKLSSWTVFWKWLAPLGGVPRAQLDLIAREPEVFAERLVEVIEKRVWGSDNYFYYGYFVGRFSRSCCPRYLEEANYPALRANVDNVVLHHGPLAEAALLKEVGDGFTIASLLDSMDWMPDSMMAEQMAGLVPRMVDGGHIFWRSFATKIHSPVLAHLEPELVPTYDRVGWYLTQYSAQISKERKWNFDQFLCNGTEYVPHNSVLQQAKVITAMGMHALRKNKDVKQFYESQRDVYDGFRECLLPNRDRLLKYCLPWHEKPRAWVSVGCGTARDIEYVVGHLKACQTQLWLVDLSPELLSIARTRIEQLGLTKQVTFVQADICNPSLPSELPPHGSVDIVTCSYCLTMIPDWGVALEQMKRFLKPNGTLALVDFTKRTDAPNHWVQRLNAWWFAHDGVWFNDAQPRALLDDKDFTTTWFHEGESRVPFTPLMATHYLYSGKKCT